MDDAAGKGNALGLILSDASEDLGGEILELDGLRDSTRLVEAVHAGDVVWAGEKRGRDYIDDTADGYREADRRETEDRGRKRTFVLKSRLRARRFRHVSRLSALPLIIITPFEFALPNLLSTASSPSWPSASLIRLASPLPSCPAYPCSPRFPFSIGHHVQRHRHNPTRALPLSSKHPTSIPEGTGTRGR
jgi:hypothetical protein